MEVVYTLTDNLHPYLLPSIMSLLDHNKVKKIWIITNKEIPYKLPKQCEVIIDYPQNYLIAGGANWYTVWTPYALMRVATAKIIPSDKVLQLDVDTIICDSLEELWNTDLEGYDVAAVQEKELKEYLFDDAYYNMGVLLWNLKELRNSPTVDRMINLLDSTPLPFPDQDAMNLLCRRKAIPSRYNEIITTGISDDPAIVHYASYNKWWQPGTPRGEYYDKYRKYERIPPKE